MDDQLNKFATALAVASVTGAIISFSADEAFALLTLLNQLKADKDKMSAAEYGFAQKSLEVEEVLNALESVLYQCCGTVSIEADVTHSSGGIPAYADALRLMVTSGRMKLISVDGDYIRALKQY